MYPRRVLTARWILPLSLLVLAPDAAAQLRATYPEPPLSLTIPQHFEPYRPAEQHPGVLDTFRRPPQGARGPVVIQLLRLGAELPQRTLRADERESLRVGAPFGFDDRPEEARAMGFTLPASSGRARTPASAPVFRVSVVLPTRGNAVQLSVLTRADEEPEARALLRAVLASAQGATSWRTPGQRAFFAAATVSLVVAAMGTLVIIIRVLLEGRTTHLGPVAQRWIARVTGLAWGVFAAWLLLPLDGAEWAAAVPVIALAITFLARGWSSRSPSSP